MNIDGRTEIYGIIGWPLGHTRSPALHNAAFGQMGMNAAYVPMPVAPGGLRAAVEGVRALGIKGLNVTVPHKVEVAQYLDRVEGVAAELGAVNVIANRDGELVGHNTDVEGFRLSMEKSGAKVEGAEVAVLGAGGAARSVIRALLDAGAGRIHLFNRTLSNAQQTAGALGGADAGIDVRAFSDAEVDTTIADCSIIINATSAGLRADEPPHTSQRQRTPALKNPPAGNFAWGVSDRRLCFTAPRTGEPRAGPRGSSPSLLLRLDGCELDLNLVALAQVGDEG
ncbi:MAG TPA: shikimate dehydrogenase, partial [bacterium]|nr:shikimate dehydrogenase [bacterium]